MLHISRAFSGFRFCFLWSLLYLMFSAAMPSISCAQGSPHHHHDHPSMSMPMEDATDPRTQAKLLADKKESEFNHHLAGIFVVFAGLFVLTGERLKNRWPSIKYAWPLCFLFSGIFVLVFSDTELWPFGPKNWWVGVTGNVEVLQHKTFAVILLALGIIEILRTKGTLKAVWSAWVFPVLAAAGSVMLLFHAHDAGLHGPDAMNTMEHIQMQHLSYAALGAGIAVTKSMAETATSLGRISSYLWPTLLVVLGFVLARYTE
jgi:copper resistance protein D